MPRRWLRLFILAPVLSCGGGDGDGGPSPAITVIAKAGAPNGDGQSGTVARALADSFRVVVTEGGVARSGVTVNWTTSAAALGFMYASSGLRCTHVVKASRSSIGTVSSHIR